MIIYILCYNKKTLQYATKKYTYPWAYPILLENQNCTFENTFWDQLKKMYPQWKDEDYVGVLSHSAYKKINIDKLNQNFINGVYTTKYVHFLSTDKDVLDPTSAGVKAHPYYSKIMKDLLPIINVNGKECFCNYFMCNPLWMKKFIAWYKDVLPLVMSHPHIWKNSKYNGKMTPQELMKLCGHPYYPHITFILERLNGCFFQTYCDSVLLTKL